MLSRRLTLNTYEAYLFDWDGTLSRTLEAWLTLLRNQYKKRGIKITDKQIALSLGNWRQSLDYGMTTDQLSEFVRECDELWYQTVPKAPLYEGVKSVLGDLRKKSKKLVLLTSSMNRTIERELEMQDLNSAFDLIVSGNNVSAHKPDPEAIRFALSELQIKPKRALLIGDADKDLAAARSAGVDSLLFYPDIHTLFYSLERLRSFNPRYVIKSWNEFTKQKI